jgi:hypothetical protein
VGPWEINAKVKTTTIAPIETPWLVYTATNKGVSVIDSVLMNMIAGDSLWRAIIPSFVEGTEVSYSITVKDTNGNYDGTISSYIIVKPQDDFGTNSVALVSIDSPVPKQSLGGILTPVKVVIQNKGDSNLTSATINWSINSVIQTPYTWTGNLSWDFKQQIMVGNYLSTLAGYDTVLVWVSSPNDSIDIVSKDDTLKVILYGCPIALSGTYTVGSGDMFPNINAFLTALNTCTPVGDVTLLLRTGTYIENWNFTNLTNLMGNYYLTITSLANNRDSVILRPASGVGVYLSNTSNLILESLTIDGRGGGTYGIQFVNANPNITITAGALTFEFIL